MYKLFYLFFGFLILPVFAIIPTIDQYQLSSDISTMTNYSSTIASYLSNISKATTSVEQVRQLHGLQQVEAIGNSLCALCTQVDEKKLQNYVNNINDDLCSHFAFAVRNITGLAQNINNISDILLLFQTNPKVAGLALQQAVIHVQVSTQNTLSQIQILMAQQAQKQLAEQKIEKQTTDNTYLGFKHSNL